jgi:hypothetical protein
MVLSDMSLLCGITQLLGMYMSDRGGNRNPGFASGSSKNFRLTQPDALMPAGEKPENRAKAVLCVASNARDAVDCYRLLDMLGLKVEERNGLSSR